MVLEDTWFTRSVDSVFSLCLLVLLGGFRGRLRVERDASCLRGSPRD